MGKQNDKLIENIRKYDEKEEIKQSKSQILGQKLVKGETNKRKEINVYNSQQRESIRNMV
jgi:uncharacterized protein YggU (UPF0235/DUF167 family)